MDGWTDKLNLFPKFSHLLIYPKISQQASPHIHRDLQKVSYSRARFLHTTAEETYTSYLDKFTILPMLKKKIDCQDHEAYEENHQNERKGTD